MIRQAFQLTNCKFAIDKLSVCNWQTANLQLRNCQFAICNWQIANLQLANCHFAIHKPRICNWQTASLQLTICVCHWQLASLQLANCQFAICNWQIANLQLANCHFAIHKPRICNWQTASLQLTTCGPPNQPQFEHRWSTPSSTVGQQKYRYARGSVHYSTITPMNPRVGIEIAFRQRFRHYANMLLLRARRTISTRQCATLEEYDGCTFTRATGTVKLQNTVLQLSFENYNKKCFANTPKSKPCEIVPFARMCPRLQQEPRFYDSCQRHRFWANEIRAQQFDSTSVNQNGCVLWIVVLAAEISILFRDLPRTNTISKTESCKMSTHRAQNVSISIGFMCVFLNVQVVRGEAQKAIFWK